MGKLVIESLGKSYGGRPVVQGVSMAIGGGEIVGLLGPNGAGKTTTFYMVVGLIAPTSGRILLDGREITALPVHRRARAGIGYLPQEPSIFRRLTVRENLLAIAETRPIPRVEQRSLVDRLLDEFGLTRIGGQLALTLSGGERRRLEIARTLITEPKFLLLDEPFSGVDPINVQEVQQIILALRDRQIGILITDHNVRETLSIVDRAYLIHDGRVLSEGPRDFLLKDPLSRKFYLGEGFRL